MGRSQHPTSTRTGEGWMKEGCVFSGGIRGYIMRICGRVDTGFPGEEVCDLLMDGSPYLGVFSVWRLLL